MKRYYYIAIACCALAAMRPGWTHPLGNFSINQYSQLDLGKSEIRVHQVLDMAEIPTFQESNRIDTDRNGVLSAAELTAYAASLAANYAQNLIVTINGETFPLRVSTQDVQLTAGALNLQTMVITWDFVASIRIKDGLNQVSFRNNNYAERMGVREITVKRNPHDEVFESEAARDVRKSDSAPLIAKHRALTFYLRR